MKIEMFLTIKPRTHAKVNRPKQSYFKLFNFVN